jgi:hypothetical protein
MKSSGRSIPSASEVIGSVEVFEQSSASGSTTPAISAKTFCFSSSLSNTASITRSQPASAFGSAVGVIRLRNCSAFSGVLRPFCTCLASNFSEYALPFSAASSETSLRTTSMPTFAQTYAIPAPIIPAPSTPTFRALYCGTSAGRDAPALIACNSKKNALIMFFAIWPVASDTKYRDSIRLAVAKSTWLPSTAALMIAFGAGYGAPLSCLRRFAGKAGRNAASFGEDGVPPGIL